MLLLMVMLILVVIVSTNSTTRCLFISFCIEPPTIPNNELEFQLLSSVDTDPKVFSLSFNVTNRSPTNVTCSINGNQFNIPENDLIRTVIRREDNTTDPSLSILVQVSVIVRMRVSGLYQCFVTTNRIASTPLTATTPERNITGTNNNEA